MVLAAAARGLWRTLLSCQPHPPQPAGQTVARMAPVQPQVVHPCCAPVPPSDPAPRQPNPRPASVVHLGTCTSPLSYQIHHHAQHQPSDSNSAFRIAGPWSLVRSCAERQEEDTKGCLVPVFSRHTSAWRSAKARRPQASGIPGTARASDSSFDVEHQHLTKPVLLSQRPPLGARV